MFVSMCLCCIRLYNYNVVARYICYFVFSITYTAADNFDAMIWNDLHNGDYIANYTSTSLQSCTIKNDKSLRKLLNVPNTQAHNDMYFERPTNPNVKVKSSINPYWSIINMWMTLAWNRHDSTNVSEFVANFRVSCLVILIFAMVYVFFSNQKC